MTTKPLRCAIYTRKSSEEGLEQDFNSLHAQREACEAYVKSQQHEGWHLIRTAYDDGGISGGTMQRPALQQLLADIEAKKVDVVVVYKVDRLTRALADFARMVELFDRHGVSFVSVTQQFNTTSSMGRLTLNVLLSFAQFEREVTGERIRDKVKASKAKGMWMGGKAPLGYDVKDRKLIVNPEHAGLVRLIFEQYLEAGSVRGLLDYLNAQGIQRPPQPASRRKKPIEEADLPSTPPMPFTRGGLANMLANPIYIGKIRHRDVTYDGMQEGTIDQALWDAVQNLTKSNVLAPRWRQRVTYRCLLIGKLYDGEGQRLVPAHTIKRGRRYSYYITDGLNRGPDPNGWRVPAKMLEALVLERIKHMLKSASAISAAASHAGVESAHIRGLIAKCGEAADRLGAEELMAVVSSIELKTDMIRVAMKLESFLPSDCAQPAEPLMLTQALPVQIKRRGIEMRLILNAPHVPAGRLDQDLVSTIAKARVWFDDWLYGRISGYKEIVQREGISASYVGDVMKLAFLSPKIVEDIIRGQQPEDLIVSRLTKTDDVPHRWDDQEAHYGWR